MATKVKTEYRVRESLSEIKDLKMDLITFEVMRNAFVGVWTS